MGHGGVGLESVAEGGARGEPGEEREERVWREGERVVVDEIDDVLGCERRDEVLERRVE